VQTLPTLRRGLNKLQQLVASRLAAAPSLALARLRQDPARIFRAGGMTPDLWQTGLLNWRGRKALLCCSRQVGKTERL